MCGTVLVNCLLKGFAICVDVTEGLLLKEIVLFLFVCIFFFFFFFVGKIF